MNDMELFLNFGAVVEIRRNYRDDLYKFCKLMISLGFIKEYIDYFMVSGKTIEDIENDKQNLGKSKAMLMEKLKTMTIEEVISLLNSAYTDDTFWHLIDINEGKQNKICIEFQWGKGFTFGKKEEYLAYDKEMKILNIDELIFACGKEDEFGLGYVETSFMKELKDEKDKELATELTDFCEWYEWELVKYSNGLYNILDLQTEELDEEQGVDLRKVIERVFYRMVDYFTDEEEHDDLNYVEKNINTFIKLGKQYNLYSDDSIKYLQDWFEEEKEFLK